MTARNSDMEQLPKFNDQSGQIIPASEFTLRQPTERSSQNENGGHAPSNNVVRISAPENSSMQSHDWQVSQNSLLVANDEQPPIAIKQISERKSEGKRPL